MCRDDGVLPELGRAWIARARNDRHRLHPQLVLEDVLVKELRTPIDKSVSLRPSTNRLPAAKK